MKVRISGRDINEGIQHSVYLCPIALALQRQYPELQEVGVKGYLIFVRGDVDIPLIYGLTEHAKSFMKQFDAGGEVVESVFDFPFIDMGIYGSKNPLREWHKPTGIETKDTLLSKYDLDGSLKEGFSEAVNLGFRVKTWGEVDKNTAPKSKGVNETEIL